MQIKRLAVLLIAVLLPVLAYGQGQNFPGSASSSGAAPSSAYTFSVSGSTITASPNASGLPTYSGTDMAVVFNNVTTQLATVGGRLFFKNGVYTANSATLESTTGCSTFDGSAAALAYVFAFPATSMPNATAVQWILEGETSPVWEGEYVPATVNNGGVIFNVSPTAISSVAAGTIIAGFWQRPVNNCTLSTAPGIGGNISNSLRFNNLSLRFPTNQRGNEIQFAPYFAENVAYDNVISDFNLSYNAMATGSAPVVGTWGSFGMASTVSSAGLVEYWRNTYAVGSNIGYDYQSEHIISVNSSAIYCNFPWDIGRSATAVYYPTKLIGFNDQENKNGGIIGPQVQQGARIDNEETVIETKNDGNWYSRTTGAYTETNCNYTTGKWTVVGSTVGVISPLFASCGANLQIIQSSGSDNFAQNVAADTFTHPTNASSWGPQWAQVGTGNAISVSCANTSIAANTGTTASTSVCYYTAQTFNPQQFSKVTVNAVTATNEAAVTVMNNQTAGNKTSYQYRCSTSGGVVTNRSITVTNSAGTPTVLLQTAAASGCGAGDIIELDVIPTGSTNRLVAYYTPSGGARIKDLEVADATLSGGNPGLLLLGGAGVSLINWTGGNLPTKTGLDSIYLDDAYTSLPRKAFVDTADYTNATTTFSNLIGVGSNNGLSFIVEKNVRYTMHCAVTWSASAVTAGPQFQITGPASPTSVSINMMSAITATTTASAAATAFASALNPVGATVTSAVNETAYIDMGLVNGANAGTIQLQAAAQGAGTLTIRQGSSCTLQ